MFLGCSSLISLPDISKWNTKNVGMKNFTIYQSNPVISLPDSSKLDTKEDNKMYSIFSECINLLNKHPLFEQKGIIKITYK